MAGAWRLWKSIQTNLFLTNKAIELMAKIDKSLTAQKATKTTQTIHKAEVTIYTSADKQATSVFFLHNNILCGTDNLTVTQNILGRFSDKPTANLASNPAQSARVETLAAELATLWPGWEVSPF